MNQAIFECSDFVNLILNENKLYAATKGEIFCLDPGTGKILWQNPLKGMGQGLVCIAAPGTLTILQLRYCEEIQPSIPSALNPSPDL